METKKTYIIPVIELIYLDTQISLAMESDPMPGPDEGFFPQKTKADPFQTT